jgi:hypothetical protein
MTRRRRTLLLGLAVLLLLAAGIGAALLWPTPIGHVHPLTRLRRTLARALPFVADLVNPDDYTPAR